MDGNKRFFPGTSVGMVIGAMTGLMTGAGLGLGLGLGFGFGSLIPLMTVSTTGLLLSQITEIAEGLTKDTIQNWVKRGFVDSPRNGKLYDKDQVARIMLFNSLRSVMELEDIKKLLDYVNGDLSNNSGNAIKEKELYELFSAVVINTEAICPGDLPEYEKVIEQEVIKCVEGKEEDKEKIKKALLIMVTAYNAGLLKKQADKLISELPLNTKEES